VKILALVVALTLVAAAGAGFVWYLDPFGSDSDDEVDLSALTGEFQGSACRQVAGIAAALAGLLERRGCRKDELQACHPGTHTWTVSSLG